MSTPTHTTRASLAKQGRLTAGETYALSRLMQLADAANLPEPVATVLALTVATQRLGDVCVDLDTLRSDADLAPLARTADSWRELLLATTLVAAANDHNNALTPFVLHGNRLYLRRAYTQEQALVAYVLQHATRQVECDETWLASTLTTLFGPAQTTGVNRQRLATAISMLRGLVVIAGGPGSGKTFTVARILALINAWHDTQNTAPLHVVLTAPTGRAAARLSATLADAAITPSQPAMTLHRLLGHRLNTYADMTVANTDLLDADVVIVDEASMVGLPLFATLLHALKPTARLILLGDSNQLGAIDTGAVFHELCGPPDSAGDTLPFSQLAAKQYAAVTGEPVACSDLATGEGLNDVVIHLNVTHRFDATGGVGQAAELMRDTTRDVVALVAALTALSQADSGFRLRAGAAAKTGKDELISTAVARYNDAANQVLIAHDPRAALEMFDRFRLLCAIHDGPYGTRSFNEQIIAELARSNPRFRDTERFTPGRFVLVTRNDRSAGVQNGDVGVVIETPGGQLQVAFIHGVDTVHLVSPYRLQAPDDPYAMSVHKAQGSQFADVVLALPKTPSPVMTRSLVYTAVTRASTQATVLDEGNQLADALGKIDRRVSGLADALVRAQRTN